MRAIRALCAVVLVGSTGCFLSHLRDGEPADAGARDAGPGPRDLGVRDAAAPDAGPPTSCSDVWLALPWCPADVMGAIDQSCDVEGTRCGFECCEPGPAIQCLGGRWQPVDFVPDCSAVRCAPPAPCGLGECAYGRACVRTEGLSGGDSPGLTRCAALADPIHSCDAAPPGSIVDGPRDCMLCTCATIDTHVEISLACACC